MAQGFAANPSTLKALQHRCRFNHLQAARACGVSPRAYRRWRSEGNASVAALRLLAVLAGYVPWAGWEGWEVHGGLLFAPGFSRDDIGPGAPGDLPYWWQLVGAYRQENQRLREGLAGGESMESARL